MIRRLVHLSTLAVLAGCSLLPPDSATRTQPAPVMTTAPPQTAAIPTATDSPTPSRTPTSLPTSTTIPTITPLPFLPTDCPTLTPTPTATATPLVSPIPSATNTGTPTNTPTSTATRTTTPDPSASPTPSATTGPTRTPTTTSTPTITPTPTPSITWTPHPCPSPTPTSTLTPTPSHTPTPTPVLPELDGLAIDTSVLEAIDPGLWTDPPEDLTPDLKAAGNQCIVDCLGFRWESADQTAMLTMLIYRTPDFRDAVASGLASQTYYLGRDFEPFPVPPVGNLPAFTWIGVLLEKDVVLITSQGPAVIIFFWQNDGQIDVDSVVDSITRYAGVQSEILREHGFLTISLQLTPFP